MINMESIQSLIEKNSEDTEVLKLIEECLLSFCEYHVSIYQMQIWLRLHSYLNMSREDFQTGFTTLDKSRTLCHNAVISNIAILNRLCNKSVIPLVYDGVITEEHPQRIAIADEVLAYVEKTVADRSK